MKSSMAIDLVKHACGYEISGIVDIILTACEEEARETQAAVEAEREACAEVADSYDILDDIISTLIRSRGAIDALAEALRKARLSEAEWWFTQIDDMGNLCEKADDCQFCKRVVALQHPKVKESQ